MKLKLSNYQSILTVLLFTFISINSYSQCSFSGLDPTYCVNDAPVLLVGTPGGGVFSGAGMTGSEFDPASAGVGTHTITYELLAAEDKYYIKSNIGNPWGNTSNNTAMTNAFGGGGWILESFEAASPATVFSSSTSFVFLEGSDGHANELNTFLIANLALIETWVNEGGCILINAAPNEGTNINFGFAGTTLIYPSFENDVFAVDPAHPTFAGPMVPTATAMTGPYYSHGKITGIGYTNVLINGSDVVLCEKAWGLGTVMVGGMTTSNYHSPTPHGTNYRANIFTYLNSLAETVACVITQDVEVFDIPDVTATATDTEICIGEEITLTGGGADTYIWDMGVIDGVSFAPVAIGTTTYNVIGTNSITGCENTASIDIIINDLPVVTATATPDEICLGETAILSGGGADDYVWDVAGVTDGAPYEPLTEGTVTYTVTGTDLLTGCENTASVDITVFAVPDVVATVSEIEICIGETVIFEGAGADTYDWDVIGVTDGVAFEPAATGTVTYTVTGALGALGCENTASIDVTVNDLPAITATASETEICIGDDITLTGGGGDTYVWDIAGVVDGVAYIPGTDGTIDAIVTGTNTATGCENTATVTFTVNPLPDVTAIASTVEVCFGESLILTGAGADFYVWSPVVPDGTAFTPAEMGTFIYTVTGSTAAGCSSTAAIEINVIDCAPVVAAIEFNNNVCIGDCITLSDISEGPVAEWAWDFGGAVDPNTSTDPNPKICLTTLGNFDIQLTVTSETGAISSTTSSITVNANPIVNSRLDTIIDIGGTANLIASSVSLGTYIWSPDTQIDCANCPITTASPRQDLTYTVTFIDENGCADQDNVMVLVNFIKGIGVPSAFSPNADGNNDILFVKGFGIKSLNFMVYNRYGEVVFESGDQNIGWDGTYKNKDENPGVFTWVLQYDLEDGSWGKQKGNVTLIR